MIIITEILGIPNIHKHILKKLIISINKKYHKTIQHHCTHNKIHIFDMYENIKSEKLKKEQNAVIIIPCWWDGKLARYK
jgi:hypothetical protein